MIKRVDTDGSRGVSQVPSVGLCGTHSRGRSGFGAWPSMLENRRATSSQTGVHQFDERMYTLSINATHVCVCVFCVFLCVFVCCVCFCVFLCACVCFCVCLILCVCVFDFVCVCVCFFKGPHKVASCSCWFVCFVVFFWCACWSVACFCQLLARSQVLDSERPAPGRPSIGSFDQPMGFFHGCGWETCYGPWFSG